ncbi:TonB-dependent receptor [Actinobacillus seminis]|uniref:Outer membrane receptor protein, mostly Fe transport n=1 Tax=Actinobacillus seminis TaxID=722 RepID=A0A263HBB3_9PAST|nr:TonB-dependent receptor plug domain-containing protein [Actinobacillus seminis]OZN24730.1 TonB-dependent receptor [Actinobacillus seminis]SUU35076.1 outer membrane receptor protein, mostly Fe transport [Actinobacillus seminis]
MKNFSFTLSTVLVSYALSAGYAQAQQIKTQEKLPEIVVYGDQNSELSSIQTISQQEMAKSPSTNGNISDYLSTNPHIRYENSDRNGFTRGEIKPENISINGADFNQTAYFVDNVNVNNDLTVDNEIFDGSMQVVPGISHTQAYFFDASMLSAVEVHDHNISASLGGFMGGAVVAKTKQYDGTDRTLLKYRATNSHWAEMKSDAQSKRILQKVRPNNTGDAEFQPNYHKDFFSLMVERGLTENLGAVFGFSRRMSRIEQNRLIGHQKDSSSSIEPRLDRQNHRRLSDTALLNLNYTPNETNRFELGFRYSRYKEEKYYGENINNNLGDYHNAYGATLAWVHSFSSGVLTNTLAYDHFIDKRKSNSSHVDIYSVSSEDYEPLYSYEKGGYGNSKLTQDNLHFSTEYAFNPFDFAGANHSLSVGGIYQASQYRFSRPQDVSGNINMVTGDEEPMKIPSLNASKGNVTTRYQNVALYVEDLIQIGRWNFRPGLRVERDDYLKNTNISPRFVTRLNPWEAGYFTFGLNRYYGRSFSSLKLTNKILKLNQDNSRQHQEFQHLKTPYADELSIGFQQQVNNLDLKLNYIHRQNKNRIMLKKDNDTRKTYYINANNYGVNVYTLQVNQLEPWQWRKTQWTTYVGFDYLDTKRADLDKALNPFEPVYLDGKLMTRQEMRKKVNSSTEDWIARVGLDMAIPDWQFTWSNRLQLKAPVKGYEEISNVEDDTPSRYRSFDYGTHFQWDMSLRKTLPLIGTHTAYLQLDILNVLNQVRQKTRHMISTQEEYGIFTPGREFWLEIGYHF